MPSLGTNRFIKITCDWQGTCIRFYPTTKQIIDDSLFSVTDYFWVYLGVRMFSIRVVIVMLKLDCGLNVRCNWGSYHESQYVAHYEHECIIESSVLLSASLVAWAFKGNESNEHLNPAYWWILVYNMMTSSNGNIFRVTGPLCGEFTGPRWIPRTKASDAELWCFLWSASE